MTKFSITLLFFTLALASLLISSPSFGQSNYKFQWPDNITINGDSVLANITINSDSIFANRNIFSDSIIGAVKGLNHPDFSSKHSKHYLSKDRERYYMDIVPPHKKGKKVDDSNIWLLGNDMAQVWR